MRSICILILGMIIFSCRQRTACLVENSKIDSMISNYSITERKKTDSAEMIFWRNRIDKYHPGLINEQKYGSCLLARFYKMGNIEDLNSADTIFKKLDERFNQTEPSISLMLAHISLMRHQFGQAK